MTKRALSGLAIVTLIVCSLAFTEATVPASQATAPTDVPDAIERSVPGGAIASEPSVAQQMQAFEHDARFRMICYTGRFGGTELAGAMKELPAIALTVESRSK